MARSSTLHNYVCQLINSPLSLIYQLIQYVLDYCLSPTPPLPGAQLGRPKIAIVGAYVKLRARLLLGSR